MKFKLLFFSFFSLAFVFSFLLPQDKNSAPVTGKGNVAALMKNYQRWQHQQGDHLAGELNLDLVAIEDLLNKSVNKNSRGRLSIDLYSGKTGFQASGLEAGEDYQLVLEGRLKSAAGEALKKPLGAIKEIDGNWFLEGELQISQWDDFALSRAVVLAASSREPVMQGSLSLFQKAYYANYTRNQLALTAEQQQQSEHFLSFLLPDKAYAAQSNFDLADILGERVAKGRALFLNETFDGNGRTCGTCHPPENNHTIDPKFIATLNADDPLFVHETNPALAELENSKLMRQFGLILTNLDGFDRPPVFRGVPHTLALATSITPEEEHEGQFLVHTLGWSGDGSPGDGSLRSFTLGAIIQHMPKTMNRQPGVDFRLANDEELDAIEAYMLSLGRTEDPDLDEMRFASPLVQRGLELFHSKEEGTGQCKGCHLNGGANSSTSFQNGNRDTGVENMPDNPARIVWKKLAVDAGFGQDIKLECGPGQIHPCFGNGEFNMTTVIEAADTAPFFHNNSVNTIEEAVAFYNSQAFHASPGANPADPSDSESVCERCIHLEPTQITAVGLFLRTLNAMENIRNSNYLANQALQLNARDRKEMLKLAIADTEDAIEVLEGGAVIANYESVNLLKEALLLLKKGMVLPGVKANDYIHRAIELKNLANGLFLASKV